MKTKKTVLKLTIAQIQKVLKSRLKVKGKDLKTITEAFVDLDRQNHVDWDKVKELIENGES